MSRPPYRIVEFGASLGISTIHLAAAIRDKGQGSLVTTELLPAKAKIAQANLAATGLDDLVELRVGDAVETLQGLDGSVDLLFLDGRNDLYLPVLRLIEPCLAPGALIVADLNPEDPDLLPYREYVCDRSGRYASVYLPLDAGVDVSVLR